MMIRLAGDPWWRQRLGWTLRRSRRLLWLGQGLDLLTALPVFLIVGSDAESNPLFRWLWNVSGPLGVIVPKLALVLFILYMLRHAYDLSEARTMLLAGAIVGLLGASFNAFVLWQLVQG